MYHDKEEFTDYLPYQAGMTIADETILSAKGRGTVQHEWIIEDGSSYIMDIKDVLHVPNLTSGLFSLNQATRTGLKIIFQGEGCYIIEDDVIIGTAPKVNNVYILSITQSSTKVAMLIQESMRAMSSTLAFNSEAVELWHRRMGHLNEADLKRLVSISDGMSLTQQPRTKAICEACQKAKSTRKVSRNSLSSIRNSVGCHPSSSTTRIF